MKRIIILFIVLTLGSFIGKAQQSKGVIKVNPLGLAFGIFNAAYELPINEKSSVQLGVNYFNYSNLDISGFGAGLEYRFYFSKTTESPEGLFLAPILNLSSYGYDYTYSDLDENNNIVTKTEKQSVFSFGGGVKGGYQWVWDSGIALDLYAGYGYRSAKFTNYDFTGGYPILGLAVGYAF